MTGDVAMQIITSALIALLLVAGLASKAQALDAKTFYGEVDRNRN